MLRSLPGRARMRILLSVLVAVGATVPASAIDLTGTWRGAFATCADLASDGTRTKAKNGDVTFSPLEISESGAGVNLRFVGSAFINQGIVLTFGAKQVG